MSKFHLVARATIAQGKAEEAKAAFAEALQIVREKDPGTSRYECFSNEAGDQFTFLETYADAEAMMAHGANVGEVVGRMVSDLGVEITSMELCGEITQQVRDIYEPMGMVFHSFVNGLEG